MSNFPFETFPLTKRIGIVNPVANLDARYGPWLTYNDALTAFSPLIREKGLTVAVSGIGGVVEYWYKNGIANNDLVLKSSDITEADILPTVTNYLSTSNIILSSIDVKGSLLSAGANIGGIFAPINLYQTLTGNWQSTYSTVQNTSANWQSTYITVSTLSALWEESAEILPTVTNYLSTNNVLISSLSVSSNITVVGSISSGSLVYSANNSVQVKTLTQNENILSANTFGIFFKAVSSDNTFVYAGFNPGQTITLYLSANHGTTKRHTLPSPTYLGGNVSESNEIYTYEGHITKTTIQRIGNEYYGVSNIVKTNISQNIGAIGRISLDSGTVDPYANNVSLLLYFNP